MEEEKRMMEEKELEEKRMMEEKELEEEVERAQQRARLLRAAENELEWERRNDFDDETPVEVEPNHYDVTRGVRHTSALQEGVEKAEASSNEMLRSVDELRSLLSSASEQQSQLEVHLDETHTQHGQYLVERDKVILQLRDRLETYEEQLQAITRR
ncbi:hypothetical protein FJT64_011742 [Amphibalanus amphitrite]|uniref:Uncharacterized protein n=1 Tax=Amphibalanus amphitrite TaxID=1232801 RepID=A0A6A4V5Z3_AMPAM|nr:hypothetical protein FJT64_011742 [Amphibalanus amphitrite]